jgi:integrin-linked kinase-associated serine/threonine phosphatase 2C
LSGSTATIALIRDDKIYIANVGDSRAIYCRVTSSNQIEAKALTKDHTPVLKEEKLRIKKYGGEVKDFEDGSPLRIFAKGKNIPGLAMTRSMGDLCGSLCGVSSDPDVYEK